MSIDRLGIPLEDVILVYGSAEDKDGETAWDRFLEDLRKKVQGDRQKASSETVVSEHAAPIEEGGAEKKRGATFGLRAIALPTLLILMALASLVLGIQSMIQGPGGARGQEFAQTASDPAVEKPSIAVLPFTNMSGDPGQEYIADGISENIISALSRIGELFVIARNSTFVYKDKAVKIQQVAEDLSVRYVLEGSVLKSGDQIRISAQLIDAATGYHLWAEKFDRNMEDFFQVLDEITREIVVALQVKLTHGEQARGWYTTTNFEAWGELARGLSLFETYTRGNNQKARALFENAVRLDPNCAFAWVMLGWTHYADVRFAFDTRNPALSFKKAFEYAERARSVDDASSDVHALQGSIYMYEGSSIRLSKKARKPLISVPTMR